MEGGKTGESETDSFWAMSEYGKNIIPVKVKILDNKCTYLKPFLIDQRHNKCSLECWNPPDCVCGISRGCRKANKQAYLQGAIKWY